MWWLMLLFTVTGCATARTGSVPRPRPGDFEQTGQASWYGRQHHGKRTASGETYDMHKLTAAHRTLPFGTRVLVTHLETGRSVEVRINDRGPFVATRVLDLSYAAARRLGAVGDGVIPVGLKILAGSASGDSPERSPPKD